MAEVDDQTVDPLKGTDESGTIIYNLRKKQEKLLRQAQRAHEWRVQVWAQQEQRLRTINAQLQTVGLEPFVPFKPDFDDADQLAHYASMKITK